MHYRETERERESSLLQVINVRASNVAGIDQYKVGCNVLTQKACHHKETALSPKMVPRRLPKQHPPPPRQLLMTSQAKNSSILEPPVCIGIIMSLIFYIKSTNLLTRSF